MGSRREGELAESLRGKRNNPQQKTSFFQEVLYSHALRWGKEGENTPECGTYCALIYRETQSKHKI